MDFTTTELEQMQRNLAGFKSVEMMIVVSKIATELAKRAEVEA